MAYLGMCPPVLRGQDAQVSALSLFADMSQEEQHAPGIDMCLSLVSLCTGP